MITDSVGVLKNIEYRGKVTTLNMSASAFFKNRIETDIDRKISDSLSFLIRVVRDAVC